MLQSNWYLKNPLFCCGEHMTGTEQSFPSGAPFSSMGGAPARRRARPGGFWVVVYPRPLRQRLPFAARRRRGCTREVCSPQPSE